MAKILEMTPLATGQRHKKAPADAGALRSQPGDGSRQLRALLSHSLVLGGSQPRGFRLPDPKSVPCDLAGPEVVVIHEPLAALSASHCGSRRNMLFCSFNSLATIPLRLDCCRSCKSRSNSTSTNGSNGGDSEELFHRSNLDWGSLPDLFTITASPPSAPPPKEWSCKASYPPFWVSKQSPC